MEKWADVQSSYTFLWTEFKTFSRPSFFISQTQDNSEILHGPRRNNCLNYENNELKKKSVLAVLNLHSQTIAVYLIQFYHKANTSVLETIFDSSLFSN